MKEELALSVLCTSQYQAEMVESLALLTCKLQGDLVLALWSSQSSKSQVGLGSCSVHLCLPACTWPQSPGLQGPSSPLPPLPASCLLFLWGSAHTRHTDQEHSPRAQMALVPLGLPEGREREGADTGLLGYSTLSPLGLPAGASLSGGAGGAGGWSIS